MEPWREKLRERFRSVGLDRLREIARAFGEEEEEEAQKEQAKEVREGEEGAEEAGAKRRSWILGELHTLKGEAKMLNLMGVARLAHAAEEQLGTGGTAIAAAPSVVRAAVLSALDAMADALREGFADEDRMSASLEAARAKLVADLNAEGGKDDDGEVVVSAAAPRVDAAAKPPAPAEPERGGVRWIRVPAAGVEELCDAVAELTTDLRRLAATLGSTAAHSRSALGSRPVREACDQCLTQLDGINRAAWSLRMVPLEPMLEDLCHHAKELAEAQGKALKTRVRAGGAQVDRDLLDALSDPLLHLIRNAVDHGVEPPRGRAPKAEAALLSLEASQVGAHIALRIEDDGRGIDPAEVKAAAVRRALVEPGSALSRAAALDMIFRAGFSTRPVASDVSGRGIGLDVVRRAVESLGGTVSVSSELGLGTRFTLNIPASASKQRLLVLLCGGDVYAIPARDVLAVTKVGAGQSAMARGAEGEALLEWNGERIPLRSMSAALGVGAGEAEPWIIVVEAAGSRVAISAPFVLGERELHRRAADALVAATGVFVGSATLDDGRLVLVVSTPGLLRLVFEAGGP